MMATRINTTYKPFESAIKICEVSGASHDTENIISIRAYRVFWNIEHSFRIKTAVHVRIGLVPFPAFIIKHGASFFKGIFRQHILTIS